MPTEAEFSRWLDAYRDAFIRLDADAAGELFSIGAIYCDSPYAQPIRGRSNIVAYWRMVDGVMRDVEFGYQILAATAEVGVARVRDALTRASSGHRVGYDGIFLARFDQDLRCVEFREWWVEEPAGSRVTGDPPSVADLRSAGFTSEPGSPR